MAATVGIASATDLRFVCGLVSLMVVLFPSSKLVAGDYIWRDYQLNAIYYFMRVFKPRLRLCELCFGVLI